MLKLETNEVPAGLEQYYEATQAGSFRLKVDGAVPAAQLEETKTKLSEFRNNNVELKRQVEQLAAFEQMFKSGEFSSEKLNARIEEQAHIKAAEMKQSYEAQIAELTEKLQGTSGKLESIVLNNAVSAAALKHGVSETALEDVVARAKAAFQVADGELVAVNGSLDAKGNKLTLDGWMTSLAEKAPHLFKASSGAGSARPGKAQSTTQVRTATEKISAGLAKLTR